MLIPAVHLNGTSGQDLLKQQQGVIDALGVLREALGQASPHARDYYVKADPAAFRLAQEEHRARLKLIAAMESDYRTAQEELHAIVGANART